MSRRLPDLLVYVFAAIACVAWTWFAGKDVNWDFLNYHLYLGRSVFAPRWDQDFLAASIQSYLNPYAYVPMAAMLAWGWPDFVVGSVLAALHAVNLLFVWLIAKRVIPETLRFCGALRVLAVLLAALSPVFLQEVGTSFIDVTTAVPCLFGYYLLFRCEDDGRAALRCLIWAGIFLGVAVGLKLTNAVFAMAAFFAAMVGVGGVAARFKRVAAMGGGLAIGFLIAHGGWGWRVFQEFGNPFFPFFNAVFQSPDFPPSSIVHFRFKQTSWWDAFTYLFRLAVPDRGVYTEPAAPDVRVGVAATLLVGLAAVAALRRRVGFAGEAVGVAEKRLLTTFVFSWGLWIATTGNGRYAIPALLLAGPVLVWAVARIAPSPRWLAYGLGSLFLLQLGSLILGSDARWNPNPWGGDWVNLHVPNVLVDHPTLLLSVDMQSAAFLSAYVHPGSGFVNIGGQHALGPDKPGFARVKRLLDAYRNVRMLVGTEALDSKGNPIAHLHVHAGTVARLGYRIDEADCAVITAREQVDRILHATGTAKTTSDLSRFTPKVQGRGYFLSCGLVGLTPSEARQYQEKIAVASIVLDEMETRCPRLFRPARPVTELRGDRVLRKYVDTDAFLWFEDGKVGYRRWPDRNSVELGNAKALLRAGAPPIDCTKRADTGLTTEEFNQLMRAVR